MKTFRETGYQGITFLGKYSQKTPLFEDLKELIQKLETARNLEVIDRYIIQHVEAKITVLNEIDIECYKE